MARRRSWTPRRSPGLPFDDEFFEDEWLDEEEAVTPPAPAVSPGGPPHDWKQHVALVGESMRPAPTGAQRGPREQQILYLVDANPVEEKVLALQETKRELADAIITADNSLIGTLTREDLEHLLS